MCASSIAFDEFDNLNESILQMWKSIPTKFPTSFVRKMSLPETLSTLVK
jgi:hypothetical protein